MMVVPFCGKLKASVVLQVEERLHFAQRQLEKLQEQKRGEAIHGRQKQQQEVEAQV